MAALLRGLRAGRALRGLGSDDRNYKNYGNKQDSGLQKTTPLKDAGDGSVTSSTSLRPAPRGKLSPSGEKDKRPADTHLDHGLVAAPATASPQCSSLRRGFRCAALRLQDESKSDKPPSSSSASYHEHYQAHSGERDTAAAAHEDSTSHPAAGEDSIPNASYQDQSGEQGEEYETEEQLQARILTAALEFVPLHGWSVEAIASGAETLGLSSASTGMFQNGAGDLVLHFIAQCNSQLTEILAEQHKQVQLGQAESKETTDFLRDAVETRLRMHIPYIESWPQAMSILLLPHNIPDSLKHLSTLVDDIWYYAGDRSTDMNWYTKRAALTGIYNTTELVMLQDSSPDFQDTWNFLDNRIQDVVNMATTAKQAQSTGEAVVQGLMGAAVTLKNLTGMNQRR